MFSPLTQSALDLFRQGGAALTAVLLVAVPLHSFAQDAPEATPGPRPVVPVITPQGGIPERQPKAPVAPQPVPDSGANPAFSSQRAGDDSNTFMVNPADGSPPVRVSESFLGLIMRNPQITDEQRTQVLQSYPNMVQRQYDTAMNQMFPDASQSAPAQPFEPQALGAPGGAGGSVSIEADPLAPGYVRISLATPDGQVVEFSAAQAAVEQMLANEGMSDEQKIQSLKNFPFKLPEEARQRFNDLSREELLEIASQAPGLQNQEFVKMRRHYVQATEGDDDTTSPTDQEPELGTVETTVVARLPEKTPPPPPIEPPATPATTEEPIRAEVAPTPGEGQTDVAPPVATDEAGISGTALAAIAVVAIGLITAAALVLRRRKQ